MQAESTSSSRWLRLTIKPAPWSVGQSVRRSVSRSVGQSVIRAPERSIDRRGWGQNTLDDGSGPPVVRCPQNPRIMFDPNHLPDPNPHHHPPIFACIIPSRPPQTNLTHLPPNRFTFQFHDPQSINHLVVFLTGIVPLPDGYGASVHFQFPNKPEWHLLGMISPSKPSAIFRLRGIINSGTTTESAESYSTWNQSPQPPPSMMIPTPPATATLGILVGPLTSIEAECSQLSSHQPSLSIIKPSSSSSATTTQRRNLPELAKAIGLNLFRYLSSFAMTTTSSTMTTNFNQDGDTWIPISVLERWWKQFEIKLVNTPDPERWLLDSAEAG